jgi:hypothetical protein
MPHGSSSRKSVNCLSWTRPDHRAAHPFVAVFEVAAADAFQLRGDAEQHGRRSPPGATTFWIPTSSHSNAFADSRTNARWGPPTSGSTESSRRAVCTGGKTRTALPRSPGMSASGCGPLRGRPSTRIAPGREVDHGAPAEAARAPHRRPVMPAPAPAPRRPPRPHLSRPRPDRRHPRPHRRSDPDEARLAAILRALRPDERAVALAWTHPGVATWKEAALQAGATVPAAMGERVRRKVRCLVAEQRRRRALQLTAPSAPVLPGTSPEKARRSGSGGPPVDAVGRADAGDAFA